MSCSSENAKSTVDAPNATVAGPGRRSGARPGVRPGRRSSARPGLRPGRRWGARPGVRPVAGPAPPGARAGGSSRPGQAEHPLGDDVAQDLRGAGLDGVPAAAQLLVLPVAAPEAALAVELRVRAEQ